MWGKDDKLKIEHENVKCVWYTLKWKYSWDSAIYGSGGKAKNVKNKKMNLCLLQLN